MNHDYTQFVKEAALQGLMLELRNQIDTLEVLLDAYADLKTNDLEEYTDLADALTKLRKIEEELTRLDTPRTLDQALRYAFDIGLTLN